MPVHRHVYEVLQQLCALHLEVQHGNCQKSLELRVCLSALPAKPEQRRGATSGTNPGPARNFTCQHTARHRSLGEKREGRAVPKTTEHLSAALVGLAHAVPSGDLPWGTARSLGSCLSTSSGWMRTVRTSAGFGGAQAFRPKMGFAFQQFHVWRGRKETSFTYSCPLCPGAANRFASFSSCAFPLLIHIVLLNIARPPEASPSAFTPAKGAGPRRSSEERRWAAAATAPGHERVPEPSPSALAPPPPPIPTTKGVSPPVGSIQPRARVMPDPPPPPAQRDTRPRLRPRRKGGARRSHS